MIYKLFFMFCFVQSIQGRDDKVNLQVYYESYDFDSRLFIATDLKDAVDLLNMNYVSVEMYAYGNAKTEVVDGKYEFTCENGPQECVGNKFDACAADILDIHSSMALINCVIDPWNGLNGEYELPNYHMCGFTLRINTTVLDQCSTSEKGSELLRKNGEATKLVAPKQLPYVLINGKEWKIDDNVTLFVALCEALEQMGYIRPKNCY